MTETLKILAQIVKENLKEIGINVNLNIMEMAAWQDKVMGENPDFEMTMLAAVRVRTYPAWPDGVASNGGTMSVCITILKWMRRCRRPSK